MGTKRRPSELAGARGGGHDQRDGGEEHHVGAGQRLQHEPAGELQRVLRLCGDDEAIEREQRRREELEMQVLHLRQPRQRERVERQQRAAQHAGRAAAGPGGDDQRGRPPGEGETGHEHEVVDQDRRPAAPRQRRPHQRLQDQVIRVRERVAVRVEDVRVEEVQGIGDDLVRHPGHDPFVQDVVGSVVARPDAGRRRHRPEVHDGQRREQRERSGGPAICANQHNERGNGRLYGGTAGSETAGRRQRWSSVADRGRPPSRP